MHWRRRGNLLLAVLGIAASARAALAGGLFVPGASPSTQSRAGAFVARADDPTALTHNPAGLAKLDGTQLYLGSNFLRYALRYQRAGAYEPGSDGAPLGYEGQGFPSVQNDSSAALGPLGFQVLPALSLSTDMGHPDWPIRLGLGLLSLQGFPSRSFDGEVVLAGGEVAPAPQRYDVVSLDSLVSFPSVAVAYSPTSQIDLGIRGSWGFGSFKGAKSIWTLRNYAEEPGNDAVFTLKESSDDFIPTIGLGALYRPSSHLEFGLAWNSAGQVRAQGTGSAVIAAGNPFGDSVETVPVPKQAAQCAPGGTRGSLKTCVSFALPQTASLGGRYLWRDSQGRERADIELDLRWEDWSAASSVRIQVDGQVSLTNMRLREVTSEHGYRDVVSTRLGGSYRILAAGGFLELRGGVAYDTKASPDSWTRADQDNKARATFATGLGYQYGRFRLDLGVGAVWEPDVTVMGCKSPLGPTLESPGCVDGQAPTSPSPDQPLFPSKSKKESPFNSGTYQSSYLMFSTGLRVEF